VLTLIFFDDLKMSIIGTKLTIQDVSLLSAIGAAGVKQTSQYDCAMSANGPVADISASTAEAQ
jgi:hypothetical protein